MFGGRSKSRGSKKDSKGKEKASKFPARKHKETFDASSAPVPSDKGTSTPTNIVWDFEGELPLKMKTTYKMDDLPEKLQKYIRTNEFGVEVKTLNKNFGIFWAVAIFLQREAFSKEMLQAIAKKKKRRKRLPYALKDQINWAKTILKPPEKPIKKILRGATAAGQGGFGEVVVMKEVATKDKVAVKKIPHKKESEQTNNFTEIAFIAECQHTNICGFHYAYHIVDEKNSLDEVWLVLEYLEGGTLGEAAAASALSENHVAFVAREALTGLLYLHSKQWVHRDLKSANIMLSIQGNIKLIDFGLCADFSRGPRIQMLGSPFWIPPEMIYGHPHSYPADVWSLGVCILELLASAPPHSSSSLKCMFMAATVGLHDQTPPNTSDEGKDFLEQALNIDYRKRPIVATLLEHPWVNRPNLDAGIDDVLRQVFLTDALQNLGF